MYELDYSDSRSRYCLYFCDGEVRYKTNSTVQVSDHYMRKQTYEVSTALQFNMSTEDMNKIFELIKGGNSNDN